jgi:thiosulfate sulfurtransferase
VPTFTRISIQQANELIEAKASVVDVRDPQAFQAGHIEGAILLDNNSVDSFIQNTAKDAAVVVYCYHGNSSQQAGQFLAEQGFEQVYSVDGGFEAWKSCYPSVSS